MSHSPSVTCLVFAGVVCLSGCGGGESNEAEVGGATSGGATEKDPGRTSLPFTGGTSSGGAGNSGGKSGITGGTSGGASSGNASCPVWPAGKVYPLFGAQFYGPDPGPCSEQDVIPNDSQANTTYVYTEDGRFLSAVDGATSTTDYTLEYDDQGRPILLRADGATTTTIEYGDGFLRTIPLAGIEQFYQLNASGYPITSVETYMRDDSLRGTMTYVYENCRMVSMYYTKADGSIDPARGFTEIAYDDEGHIITRTNANTGRVVTYDYSCW